MLDEKCEIAIRSVCKFVSSVKCTLKNFKSILIGCYYVYFIFFFSFLFSCLLLTCWTIGWFYITLLKQWFLSLNSRCHSISFSPSSAIFQRKNFPTLICIGQKWSRHLIYTHHSFRCGSIRNWANWWSKRKRNVNADTAKTCYLVCKSLKKIKKK